MLDFLQLLVINGDTNMRAEQATRYSEGQGLSGECDTE